MSDIENPITPPCSLLESIIPEPVVSESEPPKSELPDSELPDSELPDSELPDLELPDSELPGSELPQLKLTEPEVPESFPPRSQLPTKTEIKHKDIVTMQRLSKKRKLFLIQKLTKRIKMLKNKKGNELQLQKNQRKVDRFHQKINDFKDIDFSSVVSELVEREFVVPDLTNDPNETTKDWFMFELTQDKASFMLFVSRLNEEEGEVTSHIPDTLPQKRKRNETPTDSHGPKDFFTNRLSSYSEKHDVVLNKILKPKKNRPGQKARQKEWEELYGNKAKHLNKSENNKSEQDKSENNKSENNKSDYNKKSRPEQKRYNKDKPKELAPNEIIKKLKEKEKQNKTVEKAEHPSWLAKKQQSAMTSKIDVFAGTKTTFSDDD